jgi:hypothetical protein
MSDLANKPKGGRSDRGDPALVQRGAARTELIWEGKHDANGRRVAPLRVPLPFQTVETVNESAQERQRTLQFGPKLREEQWRNRLIWGDKKYVLPSLLSEFAGKVDLIYIDPPFDTGADFSFTATVPDDPDSEGEDSFIFTKEPSIIEHKAYRDTWVAASTHTCNGFTRPRYCFMNCCMKPVACMFISIGTSAFTAKQFSMKCLAQSGL